MFVLFLYGLESPLGIFSGLGHFTLHVLDNAEELCVLSVSVARCQKGAAPFVVVAPRGRGLLPDAARLGLFEGAGAQRAGSGS